METTKVALESERKIQMLQTEAISALWKRISSLQETGGASGSVSMTNLSQNNSDVVRELAQTCSVLQEQVCCLVLYACISYWYLLQIKQLQHSMQDILRVMSMFSQGAGVNLSDQNGIATQTEIIAVHTPQVIIQSSLF